MKPASWRNEKDSQISGNRSSVRSPFPCEQASSFIGLTTLTFRHYCFSLGYDQTHAHSYNPPGTNHPCAGLCPTGASCLSLVATASFHPNAELCSFELVNPKKPSLLRKTCLPQAPSAKPPPCPDTRARIYVTTGCLGLSYKAFKKTWLK